MINGSLPACHQLAPASAADWFNKGRAMCSHVCVIMHVKDPELFVVRVGRCVSLAGRCLSLYSLHMLYRDVNMIQTKASQLHSFFTKRAMNTIREPQAPNVQDKCSANVLLLQFQKYL